MINIDHSVIGVSDLGLIWVNVAPDGKIPGVFAIRFQYILALRFLIIKSPRFLLFGVNLTHIRPKSDIPVPLSNTSFKL